MRAWLKKECFQEGDSAHTEQIICTPWAMITRASWIAKQRRNEDITDNDAHVHPTLGGPPVGLHGCSRWARPRTSPRRTTTAGLCASPARMAVVGVQVAVRGGRGRGHHQGEQRRLHSHVHRLP